MGRWVEVRGNAESQRRSLDLAFHTSLYDAAGNRVIAEVMRQQWRHIRRVMGATLAVTGYRRRVWEQHAAILEAIVRRDEAGARELAAAHTRGARELLTANIEGPTAARERGVKAPRRDSR